ncbi:MAG: TrkA C-terminal domain-containing protein [Peptoniphilus sp.]|nr:TrkA C-terminal domain-containing protein [Peptoniphilus sp.]MDY6045108.1 TrkA C-terminal domain-containing protein [Peptoniphilus sp.]
MHITIIGTEFGSRLLARALEREQNEVELWIRRGATVARDFRHFHTRVYDDIGDLTEENFSRTDAFVFCDASLAAPVLAAALSNRGVPIHFIAYDSDLAALLKRDRGRFGIDYLYDYEAILAARIYRFFYIEKGLQTEVFGNFGLALLKLDIGADPLFVERRVRDIGPLEELVLVAVRRDGEIIIPNGNTVLEANDVLRLSGSVSAVRRFRNRYTDARPFDGRKKNARFLIYGEGTGVSHIERVLSEEGADVVFMNELKKQPRGVRYKIVEPIAELFGEIESEAYDGFIAASDDDADNFLAATAARDANMRNIVLCLKDERLIRVVDVSHNSGVFSGELLVSQQIKRNLFGPPDISLHMFPGRLDIYEIVLKDDVEAVGKRIEDLGLSEGFLIGGIERGGENVLAKGKTVLEAGDHLILFLLPESAGELQKFVRHEPKSFLTELFSF